MKTKNPLIRIICNRSRCILLLTAFFLVLPFVYSDTVNTDAFLILGDSFPYLSPAPVLNATIVYNGGSLYCSNGTYFDPNNDTWGGGQEFRWKDNGSIISNETSQVLNISSFTIGNIITCESRVNDSLGNYGDWTPSSNSATVNDSLPYASNVTIVTDPATSSTNLNCTWQYNDVDGDLLINTTVKWYVNDILVKTTKTPSLSNTLSSLLFIRDEIVVCSVFVTNAISNASGYVNSTRINISNSPPTFSSISLLPSSINKEDTLTCSISGRADNDGDSMTNQYLFLDSDNSTILQNWSTDDTMDCEFVSGCQSGDNIMCVGRVWDGTNYSATRNATSSVLNSPPVAQTVYIFPYAPDNTSTLECRYTFYDSDGDNESASYFRWFLNGSLTTNTTANLSSIYVNANDSWRCEVTVNDGFSNSTPVNSTAAVIGSSNPRNVIISNNGTVDEGSGINFTWTWNDPQLPFGGPYKHYLCNSSNITLNGCADSTLCSFELNSSPANCVYFPNSSDQHSESVYVMVVDGTNQTSPVEQDTWIYNRKPTIQNASINVTSSGDYNTYTCIAIGVNEPDGDGYFIRYAYYYSNGSLLQAFSGTNTLIINNGPATHGDNIRCDIRVYDGRIYSNTTSISNAFRISDLTIPSPSYVDNTITITVDVTNTTGITDINLSFKNPFNVLFPDQAMSYNEVTGLFEYDLAPNIVGMWEIVNILAAQENGEGYYFLGDGDVWNVSTAPVVPPTPPSGGGGTTYEIQEVPIIANITGFCGDGICSEGENPANCFEDCRVNFDTLFTCLYDDTIECNWNQAWFPAVLLISLGAVGIGAIYLSEVRKREKRGKRGK